MSGAVRRTGHTMLLIGRSSAGSIVSNWGLACLSLIAAFGVWFLVQDVENPRTRAIVPGEGQPFVPVEALNVPNAYLVQDLPMVQVDVEAREGDIERLSASDFRATVDVHSLFPNGELSPADGVSLPVSVTSKRDGVRIVRVLPATVQLTVVQAEAKTFQVQIRRTGSPPAGFREQVDEALVDPAFVTVTGLPSLVASIDHVEVVVPLSGVKDETYMYEGEVVALTASGNSVTVNLSATRAKVTLSTPQTFSVKSVPVLANPINFPAPGYRVTNIQVEPSVVTATGPDSVVDNLSTLLLDDIDLTNATSSFTRTPQIKAPPGVALDRLRVTVRVEVKLIECTPGATTTTPCSSASIAVAPLFVDPPLGLTFESGNYTAQVHVSGPADRIAQLKPSDIKVTVSLANGLPGTGTFTPVAVAPSGVKVESVEPMTLRLIPVAP
ncbi:hypothetical protein AYO38_01190 [bacterium SCGC AG-212-C10]|nr:hypothetical protein AYO38_01190 [bacterium SCGC AG-212-C10]